MALVTCTPVRSNRRDRLSDSDKLKLLEAQGDGCPLCGMPIRSGDRIVDEHLRALGLGGTNALDNRAIVHRACAEAKTGGPDGDLARIAKAKRQKRAAHGFRTPKRPLQGRPFPAAEPQCRASRPLSKSLPPPRPLFVPGA